LCPSVENITLDATGTASVSLLAMDDAHLNTGWAWSFRPTVEGVPGRVQYMSVLFANGATQYLDQLTTVVPTEIG
jgi:hypothetical protein